MDHPISNGSTHGSDIVFEPLDGNDDIGEPTDIVPLVRFLASDEARWITAQTIDANGGLAATSN